MNIENTDTIDREAPHDEHHTHDEHDDRNQKDTDNLLEYIRDMRLQVGDELSDTEFTRLMWHSKPPSQTGFTFLSFCDRFVMFSVPRQEAGSWYDEKGWIKKDKAEAAKKIGEKYYFTFSQPPDCRNSSADDPHPHHHLELSSPKETMVIIHPHFVKVRLYTIASHTTKVERPLKKCELLQDLAKMSGNKDGSK